MEAPAPGYSVLTEDQVRRLDSIEGGQGGERMLAGLIDQALQIAEAGGNLTAADVTDAAAPAAVTVAPPTASALADNTTATLDAAFDLKADQDKVQTAIDSVVAEIDALKTSYNDLLASLRTGGLLV